MSNKARSSCAKGRLGRELYIILEGTVVVTRAGRTVNEWGPGDHFGELAAIEAEPRKCNGHGEIGPGCTDRRAT